MSGSRGPDAEHEPTAALAAIRARAEILRVIRGFFHDHGVMEVETPVLCAAGAVDEHLDPIPVTLRLPGAPRRYLVTSPEHPMKRLLAAGSGPIYQITRVFRDGERGRLHNPEFTMLEWYRPGFDHMALMDEVEQLVCDVLGRTGPFERITYREAFERVLGLDPHTAPLEQLAERARRDVDNDRDGLLNELLATRIEPTLGVTTPTFLTDYPASQASSGRIRAGDPAIAERFELYVNGLELANGYHELLDATEQARRYDDANRRREAAGREPLPMDDHLLAALRAGLPASAGVALGVDRLVMAAIGASSIDEVIAFPIERA